MAYLSYTTHGRQACKQLSPDAGCRIGRGDQNTISLYGELVSRNHSLIETGENGTFYLHDVGSRNGTFLNGRRVSIPQALNDGDRIVIGGHELRFHQPTNGNPLSAETITSESATLTEDVHLVTVLSIGLPETAAASWAPQLTGAIEAHGCQSLAPQCGGLTALWLHNKRQRDGRHVVDALEAASELALKLAPMQITAGLTTGFVPTTAVPLQSNSPEPAPSAVKKAITFQEYGRRISHDVAMSSDAFDQLANLCSAEEHFCMRRMPREGEGKPSRVFAIDFSRLTPLLVEARQKLPR